MQGRGSPYLLFAALLALLAPLRAEEVHVAVASNFVNTARTLAARFQAQHPGRISLVTGSTGKLYAQIRHGAPFAAFLAADAERPRLLERQGLARRGGRFTYAIGRLVLWSPRPGYVDPKGQVLAEGGFHRLAIANPRLAPYGRAARQLLKGLDLWGSLQDRLVRGENVGQAFQFVRTGNAELGLVARSQVRRTSGGSLWEPPAGSYAPIEQQAVPLSDDPTARAFLTFLRSATGRALIRAAGYATPDAP